MPALHARKVSAAVALAGSPKRLLR